MGKDINFSSHKYYSEISVLQCNRPSPQLCVHYSETPLYTTHFQLTRTFSGEARVLLLKHLSSGLGSPDPPTCTQWHMARELARVRKLHVARIRITCMYLQDKKEVVLSERNQQLLSYNFRQKQSKPNHTATPTYVHHITMVTNKITWAGYDL